MSHHTPLYSVYARASGRLARLHRDLGMHTQWADLQAVYEDSKRLAPGIGVMVQRFCGSLRAGRTVGERADGSVMDGMYVGSFDDYRPTPEDMKALERIAAERPVAVYVGFPITSGGIRALRDWKATGIPIVIDMSGTNKATAALLLFGCEFLLEPYPRVDRVCEWFERDMPSLTTAGYMRNLDNEAWLPPSNVLSVVAYNGGDDHNAWDQDEADSWAEMGYSIACPRKFIQATGDGGEVGTK